MERRDWGSGRGKWLKSEDETGITVFLKDVESMNRVQTMRIRVAVFVVVVDLEGSYVSRP
jgi:hypothetical protein